MLLLGLVWALVTLAAVSEEVESGGTPLLGSVLRHILVMIAMDQLATFHPL